MIFEYARGVSTVIGLIAFIIACFFWFRHAKLGHLEKTASQFLDEDKKLLFLQENGMLPANWETIQGKEALKLAHAQMEHRRVMATRAMIFSGVLFLVAVLGFLLMQSSCTTHISNTGEKSLSIGCVN